MMSPLIPVMAVWLPDTETEAYVAHTAAPNVQGVRGQVPTPDGSSKSVVCNGGKEEKTSARALCLPQALGQESKCSILEIITGPFAKFKKNSQGRKINFILSIYNHSYLLGILRRW